MSAIAAGMIFGAVTAGAYVVGGVATKAWQDSKANRDLSGFSPRNVRAAAREQVRALAQQNRVAKGVPEGGRFASRNRPDAPVNLG